MPATVTGRLTDGRGSVFANASFKVHLVNQEDLSDGVLAKKTTHSSDGSGNFSIPNLYQGTYRLEYASEFIAFRVPASTGSFIITNILDLS